MPPAEHAPAVVESVDAAGFRHPGVGLTKDVLENLRIQVLAKKEPWITYYDHMLLSPAASRTIRSSNEGPEPSMPASTAFNSQRVNAKFIADGLKAYTQAILFYVTGDEIYRANAMRILRIWSKLDPTQYAYFTDAHIHTGIPLNRMVSAAEILRHTTCRTASLQWTDKDTTDFTRNLIEPTIETFQHNNHHFMNQHLYPLLGAMSGYIFTGNRTRYDEGVEWFTVNRGAVDQGRNGAIKRLFRLVDRNDLTGEVVAPPVVQHVEMGRDQAHGAGDLTNAEILSRLLIAQGTRVDPEVGTPSTRPDAVGPYEFLNDRILDAAEFFGRYMLGYETPWVPTAAWSKPDGTPSVVYKSLSSNYRGRLTQNNWGPYYYYRYVRGINLEERAPHYVEAFRRRNSYNWDGVDGGGDFWLFIPPAAAKEGVRNLVKPIVEPVREIEDRFTALDDGSRAMRDEGGGFVRLTATPAGSRIVLTSYATSSKQIAFRIRTTGMAILEAFGDRITLPDTRGQWKYVTRELPPYRSIGDMFYITIKGWGGTVDLDHIHLKADTLPAVPAFEHGDADLALYSYSGSTSPVTYSFSVDAGVRGSTGLHYQIDGTSSGVVFDTSTGRFSWRPSRRGSTTFAVTATDGMMVRSRMVTVLVGESRSSAVALAIAKYKPMAAYTLATKARYDAAFADVSAALDGATDHDFLARLQALGEAAAGLQMLTPLLEDGSMDYGQLLQSSTFGSQLLNALDGKPDTFVEFKLAKNLTHTLDFGPRFSISAKSFQLQVRASFPVRIGGAAIFGSNDSETWIRLTPDLTAAIEDLQTLSVADGLAEKRFRYIKIEMIQPTSDMLELSEFRIFGSRHQADPTAGAPFATR